MGGGFGKGRGMIVTANREERGGPIEEGGGEKEGKDIAR